MVVVRSFGSVKNQNNVVTALIMTAANHRSQAQQDSTADKQRRNVQQEDKTGTYSRKAKQEGTTRSAGIVIS